MGYIVIKPFADVKDNDHIYQPDDKYPRNGLKPTKARIAELSSEKNAVGYPLIKEETGE